MERDKQIIEVRELESDYVKDLVAKMPETINKMKEQVVKKLAEYQLEHTEIVLDKQGIEHEFVKVSPSYINNVFFKSLNPIMSQEPIYNAETLGIVFDYYAFVVANINDKLGNFPSSISSFCRLAGITTQTLLGYKKSNDYNLRVVANKIYDYIGDENLTLGQMGKVKETTTMFKLKTQNDLNPSKEQNINVNFNNDLDEETIKTRINKYKHLTDKMVKKGKIINE